MPIEDVSVGDNVLTHAGRWKRVTAVGSHESETIILRGNHYGLECTPNHPIYSATVGKDYSRKEDGKRNNKLVLKNERSWLPAVAMGGKYWGVPRKIDPLPFDIPVRTNAKENDMPEMNADFWYFVGRWVGDGWVRNGIPRAFGSKPDTDWGSTPEEHEARVEEIARETVPVDDDPEGILLRQAIREHLNNGSQTTAQRDYIWRDSKCPDVEGNFWDVLSASTYLRDINDSGAMVYLDGGVLDVFRRDTMMLYENLTLRKKLIIGPWDHIRPKFNPEPRFEILRFADYALKGVQNGVMDEKPITMRIMEYDFRNHSYSGDNTGYYRYESEWPLHSGSRCSFYLGTDPVEGVISYPACGLHKEAVQTGELPYRVVYGITSGVETDHLLADGETGACGKGLNFLTDVFPENTEFIGHPFAQITFRVEDAGNVPEPLDVDVFVALSDFDPEPGEDFQFCSGWMRSSLRTPKGTPTYNFLGLPWHDCKIGDNEYLEVGREYALNMDMLPV